MTLIRHLVNKKCAAKVYRLSRRIATIGDAQDLNRFLRISVRNREAHQFYRASRASFASSLPFLNDIEGRFGGAPESAEPTGPDDIVYSRFASLCPEGEPHLLRFRRG